MATLKDLRAKYEGMDLLGVFQESISETKSTILQLVSSQIERGQTGSGDIIGVYKSKEYADRKQDMGSLAPHGVIDLKYTGEFLHRLYLKVYPKSYLVRSWDKKNSALLRRFGTEIFELNSENLDYYVNSVLLPTILSKIK